MYFRLDVNEIFSYDKRHATVENPRGKLARANNLSRFGREGRRRDGGRRDGGHGGQREKERTLGRASQ